MSPEAHADGLLSYIGEYVEMKTLHHLELYRLDRRYGLNTDDYGRGETCERRLKAKFTEIYRALSTPPPAPS